MTHKQPLSVLVVIHTAQLDILLLERAAHSGFWQSVTGSREGEENLQASAQREVFEETGIDAPLSAFQAWRLSNTFEIFPEWRHRYAPGITRNVEHVFSLQLTDKTTITTAPDEHRSWAWLPWREAAERCFSWSNRDAILMLPERVAGARLTDS
jgi:dATP pyrophosphohydrolase